MKTLIVVPAFNESSVIADTILDIKKVSQKISDSQILVVDDGSTDQTYQTCQNIPGIILLKHVINRGLGASISTGLLFARTYHYDCIVTIDADGQHDPEDIIDIIKPIQNNQADVVIGTRTKSNRGQIPPDRKIIIFLSNLLTELLFGQQTSDSVSGFRAFGPDAIKKVRIKTERMEVSNELFSEIKHLNLRLAEVPIKIIYTDYSRSKGQSNSNAINIVYKLFLRLFR